MYSRFIGITGGAFDKGKLSKGDISPELKQVKGVTNAGASVK